MIHEKITDINKYIVVSCAVNKKDFVWWEDYSFYIKRLKASMDFLVKDFDYILFDEEYPEGCPPHEDAPCYFKISSMKNALEKGYKKIIWLDSAFFFVKYPQILIDYIDENEYCFYLDPVLSNGEPHDIKHFTTDYFIERFSLDRNTVDIPLISSGIHAFDFSSTKVCDFWEEYTKAAEENDYALLKPSSKNNDENECSTESWVKGHRHDQSLLSFLIYRNGLKTFNPPMINGVPNMHSPDAIWIQNEKWPPSKNVFLSLTRQRIFPFTEEQ